MTLITTNAELIKFCASLQNAPYITVDTEFLREKTYYAKLCLIQLSGPDKQAAAIDVLSEDEDLDLAPVWDLMHNKDILKVFHAARQDLEIMYQLSGKVPAPLYDTQIAAMVCGYGEQVGYEALVSDICKIRVDKSSQFTDWSNRPLSKKQLNYALGDVIHLVDIYESLDNRLEQKNRHHWVIEETQSLTNPGLYEIHPEDAWKRLKLRSPKPRDIAVAKELAAWRETEAQRKDVPRNRIIKDETLLDIAYQKPKTDQELARIRGFSADMAKGRLGKIILGVVEKGLAIPEQDCPEPPVKTPFPQKLAPTLEMLKMLLRIQASENDVAARLIASSDELEEFVKTPESTDHPVNMGWRHEIFGLSAHDMMNGKTGIALKKGKVHLLRL